MADTFRIGFVPGVTPGKWLGIWRERMPDTALSALPVQVEEQRELLRGGELDMCFVRLPLDRDGLHVIPLYSEVPVVVAAKEHPIAAFEELDVADLAGEHLLQDAADCPEWAAVADEIRDGTRVAPPPMTTAEAIEVAASGTGIVIVPMSLARLHDRKDVRYRRLTGVAESQVGLAWLVENEDPRVEEFIGVVRGRTARSSRGRSDDGDRPPQDGPRRSGDSSPRAARGAARTSRSAAGTSRGAAGTSNGAARRRRRPPNRGGRRR